MRKINKIVIHHSVSPRDLPLEKSLSSFNRTHKNRLHGSSNSLGYHIAYHWVIAGDGSYKQTRADNEIGYHGSDYKVNKESIGICLTGNFDVEQPSKAQYKTLEMLIAKYPGTTIHLHNEFASKSCPGKNFNIKEILMLFYEKLWNDNYKDIPKDERMFKDPAAFVERMNGLGIKESFSEMAYLIAILAEKLGKKIDE